MGDLDWSLPEGFKFTAPTGGFIETTYIGLSGEEVKGKSVYMTFEEMRDKCGIDCTPEGLKQYQGDGKMTLKKVKEKLEYIENHIHPETPESHAKVYANGAYKQVKLALAELNTYMEGLDKDRYHYGYAACKKELEERLDSEELVESMMIFMNDERYTEKLALSKVSTGGRQWEYFAEQKKLALHDLKNMRIQAKAAINIIKGKDNAK